MAAKKKVSKKSLNQAIVDRFEGTIIEQPILIANKAFLAGLGLATQLQSNFDKKFDELAKDGEKVRDQAQSTAAKLRDSAVSNAKSARKTVTSRVESAINTVLDYSPIATTDDVNKLNKKLDKVLVQVSK